MISRKSMFLISGLVVTVIITFISSFSSSSIIPIKTAFGDGLFMEELSASFGNRKADLLIKMTPPVVTTETLQDQKAVIQFKLFDSNTREGIKHVTYFITIEKDGKKLLSDMFHDHNGDLRLQIRPKNTDLVTVYGEPDPILQAYQGTENSPVIAEGPVFLEGGLYHFIVRIITIDFDRTIIPDDKQPVYDAWLSVGLTEEQQITVDGKQIPIEILSYYDKINDFTFNESKMQMEFTMPFDWNTTRLEKNKVLVHQEVTVPKPSEFTANRSYAGTVNDIDVTKSVVLDDTDPQKDIIHFMIPKNQIVQIAEQVNNKSEQAVSDEPMKFTLQPGGSGGGIGGGEPAAAASTISTASATTSGNNQTQEVNSTPPPNATSTTTTTTSEPIEKLTDGGTYKVKISWNPANIQPMNPTTFNIEFLNPKSNQKIADKVQYDFMIMPAEDLETMITHRASKIAQNGSAQQSFTFTDENVGSSVMVRVSNINNTGEFVDFPITVT